MKFFTIKEQSTGERGEDSAVNFLKKKGYKVLERNWYNRKGKRLGEIDIIAEDKKTHELIFVEVKTRVASSVDEVILPEEQITINKLQKLQRVAESYIKEHGLWEKDWRFDAMSVINHDGRVADIKHIKNVFF